MCLQTENSGHRLPLKKTPHPSQRVDCMLVSIKTKTHWVAVNRSQAEDSAKTSSVEAVDALFDGLSYRRIDVDVGDTSALASELWRIFLVAMALALRFRSSAEFTEQENRKQPFNGPRTRRWKCGIGDVVVQEQQGSLEFLSSSPIMVLGVLVVAVTSVLCWLAWHRSGYRKQTGWLELLRFVLVCLVVVTLNQPEWLKTQPPDRRSTLAVLWDQSKSMETLDVFDDQDLSGERKSRAEAIQPLMSEAVWRGGSASVTDNAQDADALNVVFEPFSSTLDPPETATDLNAGLSHVLDNHANLRGVVLLSDGDWNVGNSPVAAATRFRMKGIPVFAVGVGSSVPLPDLELVRMDAPTFAVVNKQIRIPFVVHSTLGQDRDVRVTLNVNKKSESVPVTR